MPDCNQCNFYKKTFRSNMYLSSFLIHMTGTFTASSVLTPIFRTFTVRPPCAHSCSPCVRLSSLLLSVCAYRSQSAHRAFTSVQKKPQGSWNKLFIFHPNSVYIIIVHHAFTVHISLALALRLRSAFAHRSPFISDYQIPFSVLSSFA